MGPWRALMCKARGRPRYPPSAASSSSASLAFSSLSLVKAERHQPWPLAPIVIPPHEFHDACPRLNERIWPGLGLGFAQKNGRRNVEDFLLDSSSKEGLGGPDLGFAEGFLQSFEQNKPCPAARASSTEFAAGTLSYKKPFLKTGASPDDTKSLLMDFLKQNAPKHAKNASLRFSTCDFTIRAPGFFGSEDFVIQADSVKRKRKKKMNKHKHRKLRRLARKSHK